MKVPMRWMRRSEYLLRMELGKDALPAQQAKSTVLALPVTQRGCSSGWRKIWPAFPLPRVSLVSHAPFRSCANSSTGTLSSPRNTNIKQTAGQPTASTDLSHNLLLPLADEGIAPGRSLSPRFGCLSSRALLV